jgi:hypothetical protein
LIFIDMSSARSSRCSSMRLSRSPAASFSACSRSDIARSWSRRSSTKSAPQGKRVERRTRAEFECEEEASPAALRAGTKLALLLELLQRKGGATIAEVTKAMGWQAHSVRGAISGALKKKLGLAVASDKVAGRCSACRRRCRFSP